MQQNRICAGIKDTYVNTLFFVILYNNLSTKALQFFIKFLLQKMVKTVQLIE